MTRLTEAKLTEVCLDPDGNVLWKEPYVFKRLCRIGEEIIQDSTPYRVLFSQLVGNLVLTVCEVGTRNKKKIR